MVRFFFCFFLVFSSVYAKTEKRFSGLEEVIAHCLKDFQVPGLAIAVVDDKGLLYAKGFGFRDLENALPVTTDTLFPIASCTKAFTAFAVGCLVDQKALSWDQPVIGLLNEFRLSDCYATQMISFRDLLAHRSGLSRHDFMWYNSTFTREDLIERLRYLSPGSGFRERFEYNNYMYLVAGLAIEKVSGKSWEAFVSEKIFEPLRMKRSNFSIEALQNSSDIAFPYLEKNGFKRIAHRDASLVAPGACINSSVSEMSRWAQMLLNSGFWEGRVLITPSTLSEMYEAQPFSMSKESIGLGWRIDEFHGHKQISHDGVIDGFSSIVALLPKKKIGVVVLCNKNLNRLPRLLAMHVFDRLLELTPKEWFKEGMEEIEKERLMLLKEREAANRKEHIPPSHDLKDYTGEYTHPAYGTIFVDLIDGALSFIFNHATYRLEHWYCDLFRICESSEEMIVSMEGKKVNFRKNLEGEIDEVQIAFEADTGPIQFIRSKVEEDLFGKAYLGHFVGKYQIYHKTFEIALQDGILKVLIPGGSPYELIPDGENEFLVKGNPGRRVYFVLDLNGKIKEVFLREPHGSIYTAKPRN